LDQSPIDTNPSLLYKPGVTVFLRHLPHFYTALQNNLEGAEELLASIAGEYAKVEAALEAVRKTLT